MPLQPGNNLQKRRPSSDAAIFQAHFLDERQTAQLVDIGPVQFFCPATIRPALSLFARV